MQRLDNTSIRFEVEPKEAQESPGGISRNLSEAQFDKLLELLKPIVKAELAKEMRMWSAQDVCQYMNISMSTLHRMRKQPDFPKEVTYPYDDNGTDRTCIRWVPEEIKRYKVNKRIA